MAKHAMRRRWLQVALGLISCTIILVIFVLCSWRSIDSPRATHQEILAGEPMEPIRLPDGHVINIVLDKSVGKLVFKSSNYAYISIKSLRSRCLGDEAVVRVLSRYRSALENFRRDLSDFSRVEVLNAIREMEFQINIFSDYINERRVEEEELAKQGEKNLP